jgi:hypothetical protein
MDIQSSFHMNDTNTNDYKLNDNNTDDIDDIDDIDNIDDIDDTNNIDYSTTVNHIVYNLENEQNEELANYNYHLYKDTGNWYFSKMIVSHSWQDQTATEFLTDYLESQFQANNDCFENINAVYYKNDLDIDIRYSFEADPGKHLVDNLRIPAFKHNGLIFNNPEDSNKWNFKIVVITSRGIYAANRYISEGIIGFYYNPKGS